MFKYISPWGTFLIQNSRLEAEHFSDLKKNTSVYRELKTPSAKDFIWYPEAPVRKNWAQILKSEFRVTSLAHFS